MKLATSLLFAAGLAVAALGVIQAPDAGAAAQAKVKTAKFKVQIKGSQALTWSYDKPQSPPCVGASWGNGAAHTTFSSDGATKVSAIQVGKGNPLFEISRGRPMLTPSVPVGATAIVDGEYDSSGPPQPDQCEDNGGGVVEQPDVCGTAAGAMDVGLSYVNENRLLVKGDAHGWVDSGSSSSSETTELRNLFDNCPYWVGGPFERAAAEGDLQAFSVPLKEKHLFNAKKKKFVLDGSREDCYEAEGLSVCGLETGDFRGKVITAWKLVMKRVG